MKPKLDLPLLRRSAREHLYCDGGPGSLLHTVQMGNIFSDSKTFVDMKLNFEPEVVLGNWDKFMLR